MRALIWTLTGLLLAGCGEKPEPRTLATGGLQATFIMTPDPPRVGHDSGFAVTLTEGGQPATGATVNYAFFFRGLNQTGPTAVGVETSPGSYEAREVSTGMGGKWEAEVTVTRAGKPDAHFTFGFRVGK